VTQSLQKIARSALAAGLLTVAILVTSMPASAQSGLTLGKPGYGGSGCPGGTASVALAPDGKSLSLRFTRYRVAAGGGSGRSFDRKNCSLAIPVNVPSGKSVSIISADYRGTNNLPAGASLRFSVETFFAGGRGPQTKRSFSGPKQGSFSFGEQLTARSAVWSGCGTDIILRNNSSLLVNSAGGKVASASISTQDISTAIVYRLQWRAC
jgi:hypothetical protein